MKAWMVWAQKCGDQLLDFGAPLSNAVSLASGGSSKSSDSDITVIMLTTYSKRAKRGETKTKLKKIESLGKVSLLSGILIVVLALLIFR